jgi:imidazolonepropionase-like amidohydrolase
MAALLCEPAGSVELVLPPNTLVLHRGAWVRAKLWASGSILSRVEVLEGLPEDEGSISLAPQHYCIPGLIDTHVHVTACTADLSALARMAPSLVNLRAAAELRRTVRRGFTTVRDCGGADHGLAQAAAEGTIMSPRCSRLLFVGHAISQTGGHGDMRTASEDGGGVCGCCASMARGLGIVADGVSECRKVCRDELRKGAHCIKIMASGGVASPTDKLEDLQFSADEIRAIVDEAVRKKTYVCAHAYTAEAILRAVRLGVTSIEHGNLLDEEAAIAMRDAGAHLSQTIVTYAALVEDGLKYGMPQRLVDKVGNLVQEGVRSVRLAKEIGVNVTYGSDLLGEMRPRQLEGFRYLLDAGLTPAEALRTANENAAKLLGLPTGAIEEGLYCDLTVLNVDPLREDCMRALSADNVQRVYVAGERVL